MNDELFIRGEVPMTKEMVRILTLDRLRLEKACCFIDIGAGTGSISVEAALRYPELKVIAIEEKAAGIELIRKNRDKFGVSNLEIIQAKAPVPVSSVRADAIFIGGSGGKLIDIINWSYTSLNPGGRLVLNCILLDHLFEAKAQLESMPFNDLEITELQIAALTPLGKGFYFKPNNPVFMLACQKGGENGDA